MIVIWGKSKGKFLARVLSEKDYSIIQEQYHKFTTENQKFERLECTREEALSIFIDNPFKQQILNTKVQPNELTTLYRCGSLIDLCRGPHLPSTGRVKGFSVIKHSSCYWLGNSENDTLQRVYGNGKLTK